MVLEYLYYSQYSSDQLPNDEIIKNQHKLKSYNGILSPMISPSPGLSVNLSQSLGAHNVHCSGCLGGPSFHPYQLPLELTPLQHGQGFPKFKSVSGFVSLMLQECSGSHYERQLTPLRCVCFISKVSWVQDCQKYASPKIHVWDWSQNRFLRQKLSKAVPKTHFWPGGIVIWHQKIFFSDYDVAQQFWARQSDYLALAYICWPATNYPRPGLTKDFQGLAQK